MGKFAWLFGLVFVVLACSVFYFVVVAPKRNEANKLREELVLKEQQQRKLEAELREVKRQINQLKKKKPEAVEAIARDKFGYCREGEEIYDIEMPKDDK
ncbi:MAG: septum formation initiator family protein [Victivallales bacterium]|nr:septum formation initiator family protein [Victivallales bacterium]